MKTAFLILPIILVSTLIVGCSSPQPHSPLPTTLHPSSQIHIISAGTLDEWSLSLGCYSIATGYAYNTGDISAPNVIVYIALKYYDGTIRDSKVINLGSIEPSESKNYQITLDRECGESYYIDVNSNI